MFQLKRLICRSGLIVLSEMKISEKRKVVKQKNKEKTLDPIPVGVEPINWVAWKSLRELYSHKILKLKCSQTNLKAISYQLSGIRVSNWAK